MSLTTVLHVAVMGMVVFPAFAKSPNLPITFEAPQSWILQESGEVNNVTVFRYQIPNSSKAAGKVISSEALIQLYKLPDGITFALADTVVSSRLNGATLVASRQDGKNWKTYIFTSDKGNLPHIVSYKGKQPLIILYRIGMLNGFGVEAMICFPLLATEDNKEFSILTLEGTSNGTNIGVFCNPANVSDMVHQFNEFCSKLRILGTNTFSSQAKLIDPPSGSKYYEKIK